MSSEVIGRSSWNTGKDRRLDCSEPREETHGQLVMSATRAGPACAVTILGSNEEDRIKERVSVSPWMLIHIYSVFVKRF